MWKYHSKPAHHSVQRDQCNSSPHSLVLPDGWSSVPPHGSHCTLEVNQCIMVKVGYEGDQKKFFFI